MAYVNFGDITSDDLNLVFVSATISTPAAKTSTVSVPYADGSIDLSDYFGTIRYENRTLTMTFYIPASLNKNEIVNQVINYLHGKKKEITLPSDDDYHYTGRLSVSAEEVSNTKKCSVTITADCEPYKVDDATGLKKL